MNDIPRRIRLDLMEPAELAIHKAMQEVEKLPADVRLTNAVIMLGKAKDLVADFVDGVPSQKEDKNVSVVELEKENKRLIDLLEAQVKYNTFVFLMDRPNGDDEETAANEDWEQFKKDHNLIQSDKGEVKEIPETN